jgi:ribonuclease HI
MDRTINIVTDGSAIGNPGPGGWGAVFTCGRQQRKLSGASQLTTAAEMELTAVLEALKSIEPDSHVNLSSDCDYLIRGMRFQAMRWERWDGAIVAGCRCRTGDYGKNFLSSTLDTSSVGAGFEAMWDTRNRWKQMHSPIPKRGANGLSTDTLPDENAAKAILPSIWLPDRLNSSSLR